MTETSPPPELLDRLERQLVEAFEGELERRRRRPLGRAIALPARTLALAFAAVLTLTAAALAASSLLPIGSTVTPKRPLNPEAGVGRPAPSGSMTALTAADPEGGPRWGMRIVRTSRGLTCLQVGRVQDGRLGQLGIDGAFHDDGKFHPLSVDAIRNAACVPDGQSLSASVGASPSGVVPLAPIELRDERLISYGLLGPKAVRVTYRSAGRSHTVAVEPHTGAYLIVTAARGLSPARLALTEDGGIPGRLHAGPVGALTAISYRSASGTCEQVAVGASAPSHPCHNRRISAERLSKSQARGYRRPVHLKVRRTKSGRYVAIVTFVAPRTVRSATSSYIIGVFESCGGLVQGLMESEYQHDAKRGETVRHAIRLPVEERCRARISAAVQYLHAPTAETGPFQISVGDASAPAFTFPKR